MGDQQTDADIVFGADFTEAAKDIETFYQNLADGVKTSTVPAKQALEEVADTTLELGEAAIEAETGFKGLTIGMVAAGAAAGVLLAGMGAVILALSAVRAGIGFFVDSLYLAMDAEAKAYEEAVKLAEANGDVAPANHTLKQSFAELADIITEAKAALGTAFLPVVKELVPLAMTLAKAVRDLAQDWAEWAVQLTDTSGLNNLENFILRISAHIIALGENVKGIILQLETAAFIAQNTFTITTQSGMEKAMDEFNEAQRKKYGYEGEQGKIDYADDLNHPLGRPGRVEEIFQSLQDAVKQERAKPVGEDNEVKVKNALLDAYEAGSKWLGEAILENSEKGSKMYLDMLEDGAKAFGDIVNAAEAAQWAEAEKQAAKIQDKIDNPRTSFRSGFEDSVSVFRRIQSSVASGEDDIPKQQLTVAERQLVRMVEQHRAQQSGNTKLDSLIEEVKKGQVARAG